MKRATRNDHMDERENGWKYQNENVLSYEASNTWEMLNNIFKYISPDVDMRERIFIAKTRFFFIQRQKFIFLLLIRVEKREKIYEKLCWASTLRLEAPFECFIFFKTFLVATLLSSCEHRSAGVAEVNLQIFLRLLIPSRGSEKCLKREEIENCIASRVGLFSYVEIFFSLTVDSIA